MNKRFIQKSIAVALLGMSSSAFAAQGVFFDPDGNNEDGGADFAAKLTRVFDWKPGNTLITGTNPLTPGGSVESTILGQGEISTLNAPDGSTLNTPGGNWEITYQYSVRADHQIPSGSTHTWSDIGDRDLDLSGVRDGDEDADPWAGGDFTSFFNIYYSDTSASKSNNVSGLGFGDDNNDGDLLDAISSSGDTGDETGEILILSGRVNILFSSFTPATSSPPNFDSCGVAGDTRACLDGFGTDQQNGVETLQGTGSALYNIDVTFADTDFFTSDITSFLVDMNFGPDTAGLQFTTQNPWDYIVGVQTDDSSLGAAARNALNTSIYGDDTNAFGALENNFLCGSIDTCSFHMQADSSSTVFHSSIPEPGTLALLAASLLGGAPMVRRRAKKRDA